MSFFCCAESGGGLVSCSTTDGGGNSTLRHRLCEREGAWSFQTTTCPSASLSGRTVALQTALDKSRGIVVPFLVSRGASSDVLEVHSLSPSPSDTLVSHGTLNTDSGGLENNLTVLDGPTLVWGQEEKVCVALPDVDTGVGDFTKRDIVLGGFIGRSGLTVERLWAFHCHDDSLLLLVRCSNSSDCVAEPVTQWCCLSVDVVGKRGELDVRLVPPHHCVPADYGCVAVCVAVCQFWGVGGEGGMWSETCVLIGTSYRQLVLLRGGIPVHCVAMEATPMHLRVLLVSGDEVVVAVKSVDGRVKAYRVPSCGEREVREEGRWEGVSQTAVGDFASLNRQQLLLLLARDDGEDPTRQFIVTDFCGFNATSCQGGVKIGVAKDEVAPSLISVVEALRKRQQVGEADLMELERRLQEKTGLLREGLQLVASLPTIDTSSPPPRDQSLVCLLPGKMETRVDDKVGVAGVDSAHCVPVVTECWQRLLDGFWVVGVVLKNNTNCVWWQVSVGLKLDGLPVVEEGESKLVWISSQGGGGSEHQTSSDRVGVKIEEDGHQTIQREGSSGPPASKRARRGVEILEGVLREAGVEKVTGLLRQRSVPHGSRACVVSRVPLPSVPEWNQTPGCLSAGLVVKWRKLGSGRMSEGVRVVEVGRVELSQAHLADRGLWCEWEESLGLWDGGEMVSGAVRDFSQRHVQDLACLLATQTITQLKLHSHYSDLNRLADTLRARMPLSSRCILPHPHSIPPQNGNGSMERGTGTLSELERVFLHVSGEKHTATVSVLHKSPPCLSVVMSAIQSCLPDDVTLSHPHSSPSSHVTSEQRQVMRQCVAAVRRELDVKRETVRREREELVATEEETDFAMFRAMETLDL